MKEEKIDIKSMLPEEIAELMSRMGQPAYRAGQIFKWLHAGVTDFEQMTDLSKELRARLEQTAFIASAKTERMQKSRDGTIKYLRNFDGSLAESVFMRYKHGNTICVSCQAGCRMGCAFCASTLKGLERNLRPSEILDQVLLAGKEEAAKVSNIVMMGTGEPLDNYDNVMKFLKLVNHPKGINIGHRHISVSTCGLADRIDRLADENLQITLSVSLHAPFNELRSQIMPVNNKFPVERLIEACRRYFEKTGRRISFEYAMINNFNDNQRCAAELARLTRGMAAHVNLIPLNRVKERGLDPSPADRIAEFQSRLEKLGVNATVRRTLGSDIDASCGQLRNRAMEGRTEEAL